MKGLRRMEMDDGVLEEMKSELRRRRTASEAGKTGCHVTPTSTHRGGQAHKRSWRRARQGAYAHSLTRTGTLAHTDAPGSCSQIKLSGRGYG